MQTRIVRHILHVHPYTFSVKYHYLKIICRDVTCNIILYLIYTCSSYVYYPCLYTTIPTSSNFYVIALLYSYGDEEDDDDIAGGLPPPRLFCDICDVFDEHDTDDCPLQAASDSPPHSMHHGKRAPGGSDRPYCDNCEGKHWYSIHACWRTDFIPHSVWPLDWWLWIWYGKYDYMIFCNREQVAKSS